MNEGRDINAALAELGMLAEPITVRDEDDDGQSLLARRMGNKTKRAELARVGRDYKISLMHEKQEEQWQRNMETAPLRPKTIRNPDGTKKGKHGKAEAKGDASNSRGRRGKPGAVQKRKRRKGHGDEEEEEEDLSDTEEEYMWKGGQMDYHIDENGLGVLMEASRGDECTDDFTLVACVAEDSWEGETERQSYVTSSTSEALGHDVSGQSDWSSATLGLPAGARTLAWVPTVRRSDGLVEGIHCFMPGMLEVGMEVEILTESLSCRVRTRGVIRQIVSQSHFSPAGVLVSIGFATRGYVQAAKPLSLPRTDFPLLKWMEREPAR